MTDHAIESTAEEVDASAPGTALAPRVSHEVIRSLDPKQVKAAMQEHQRLLREILDDSDWQGEPDAKGSFVKKSGWRKVALAYNLRLERVTEEIDRDEEGMALRASYTARATAPNGRAVEATGHCAYAESRFSGPRGNTTKLENDIRATAETRAKNRAISDLIGMGKVSAEEAEGAPPYGPAYEGDKLLPALAYLIGGPDEPDDAGAAALADKLNTDFGYMPHAVARGLMLTAAALKAQDEGEESEEPEPEPAAEEPPVEGEVQEAEVVPEDEPAPEAGTTDE